MSTRVKRKGIYYVYALCYPDETPFYVGKGKGTRAWKHFENTDNPFKTHIMNKIVASGKEVIVSILEDKLPESVALRREIDLISQYGRRDKGTGILCNLTDGGDGVSGMRHTEENKKATGKNIRKHWAKKDSVFRTTDYREKVNKALRASWTPEMRKKKSELTKELWESGTFDHVPEKLSALFTGRPISEKQKKDISNTLKRRYTEGLQRPGEKLSKQKVFNIRKAFAFDKKSMQFLADKYFVTVNTINNIVSGNGRSDCENSQHLVPLCIANIRKGSYGRKDLRKQRDDKSLIEGEVVIK